MAPNEGRWGGRGRVGRHMTVMAKKRSLHCFSVWKPEGKRQLSRLGVDGRIKKVKSVPLQAWTGPEGS